MFDVSFTELLLIGLVALLVLGPQRLPEVARAAGRWAGKLRRFVSDVKQDLDREMNRAELDELRRLKQELDETRRVMQDTSSKLVSDFASVPAAAQAAVNPVATANEARPETPPAPEATKLIGAELQPAPIPATGKKPPARKPAKRTARSTKSAPSKKKHVAARSTRKH